MKKNKIDKKELTFRDLVDSLIKTRVPIHLLALSLVLPTITSIFAVNLSGINARIMGGEVFNNQLIKTFVIYTIVNAILNLPNAAITDIIKNIYLATIQNKILGKMIKLPMRYFDKENGNSLISRYNQDATAYVSSTMLFVAYIPTLITIYLPFMNLYNINKMAAIVYTGLGVLKVLVMYYAARWRKKGTTVYLNAFSKITAYITERVNLLKFIKTSGTEISEENFFEVETKKMFDASVYKTIQELKYNILNSSVDTLTSILLYGVGGILVTKDIMSLTDLLTFINMGPLLSASFAGIVSITSTYQTFKAEAHVITRLLQSDEEVVSREESISREVQDIVFENVTFGYNDKEILKDVNITIPKGKVTAIVGPSGSGKTTVLKMVERFYEPNKGTIKIGDTDVEKIHLDEYRRSFGYIVQSNQMIPGTIKENICYGIDREVSEEELIKIAKLACVYECIESFPDGFDTMANSLSTGQKQRVSIARAIMTNPNYLILDEATSNVDVENEYDIMNSLRNFMKDKTTIVVAHKLSTIKNADQIIVVDKGQIVGVGKHNELKENNELYRRFCEVQAV